MTWSNRSCFIVLFIISITLPVCHIFVEPSFTVKWESWLFLSFLGGCLLVLSRKGIPNAMNVDRLYLYVSLLTTYLSARAYMIDFDIIALMYGSSFWLVYSYFYFEREVAWLDYWITVGLVFVGVIQAITGIVQYIGGDNFVMGTYDNPAGFAISLACILPFGCSAISRTGSDKTKYLYETGLILIIIAVLLSDSRTGIIASLIVLLFWKVRSRKVIGIILFGVFLSLAFLHKSHSTLGHGFIYQTSLTMVDGHSFFWGRGCGSFKRDYMKYQANELRKYPENHATTMLADNVFHPFNEFLLILIEYGAITLLLLSGILFFIFTSCKRNSCGLLCMVAIVVSSCFSYPFRYPLILFLLAYSLASFRIKVIYNVRIRKNMIVPVFFVVCMCGMLLVLNDVRKQYMWKRQTIKCSLGKYQEAQLNYMKLLSSMQCNPYFLFNYSNILFQMKDFNASLGGINRCTQYLNDYDTEMLLADNHSALNNYIEA